jgi:hypothetical protein
MWDELPQPHVAHRNAMHCPVQCDPHCVSCFSLVKTRYCWEDISSCFITPCWWCWVVVHRGSWQSLTYRHGAGWPILLDHRSVVKRERVCVSVCVGLCVCVCSHASAYTCACPFTRTNRVSLRPNLCSEYVFTDIAKRAYGMFAMKSCKKCFY